MKEFIRRFAKNHKGWISPIKWIGSIMFVIWLLINLFPALEDIHLHMYKNKVKEYVDSRNYSENAKEILYEAIDHIRYPENIGDYKRINLMHTEHLSGTLWLFMEDGSSEHIEVDSNDWYVIIGETTLHRYYNAIIDYETHEYLGSVPIA